MSESSKLTWKYNVDVKVGGEWDFVTVTARHRADAKKRARDELAAMDMTIEEYGPVWHYGERRPKEERLREHRREIGIEARPSLGKMLVEGMIEVVRRAN